MATKFPFLSPNAICDAARRRPGHPDYDPRTLHVPDSFLNSLSPGQQQWWRFKRANFDSVLLFKMGKFYEMFEMDAYVGVDVLGLSFMSGEQPHAGFPEAAYFAMAQQLARAGHRVVVVEQVRCVVNSAEYSGACCRHLACICIERHVAVQYMHFAHCNVTIVEWIMICGIRSS